MLKWGIMATGTIARKFADTLNRMADGENRLTACASRSKEKAESFGAEFGAPLAFGSYEDMAASPDVDAVYICTPNDSHAALTRMCLEQGKHVLCEKPFTTSPEEAEALYALAAEKGLFLMEALWTYHLPLIRETQRLLKEGVIGKVSYLRAEYGFIAGGSRRERKLCSPLGGGALLDIGIYNLAFANQMLFSGLERFTGEPALSEYGTDWLSTLSCVYGGGERVSLTASIGLQIPTEGLVVGSEGRLLFPDYQKAERLLILGNDGTRRELTMPFEVNGFEYQIRETARCIREGLSFSPVYPPEESVARMRELKRIRQAWGMKFSFEE